MLEIQYLVIYNKNVVTHTYELLVNEFYICSYKKTCNDIGTYEMFL